MGRPAHPKETGRSLELRNLKLKAIDPQAAAKGRLTSTGIFPPFFFTRFSAYLVVSGTACIDVVLLCKLLLLWPYVFQLYFIWSCHNITTSVTYDLADSSDSTGRSVGGCSKPFPHDRTAKDETGSTDRIKIINTMQIQ